MTLIINAFFYFENQDLGVYATRGPKSGRKDKCYTWLHIETNFNYKCSVHKWLEINKKKKHLRLHATSKPWNGPQNVDGLEKNPAQLTVHNWTDQS